jgi:CheY-like chemotaxis protein
VFALIDVNMPDIDGYALVKQLRRERTPKHLYIIMTGALSEQISQEQLDALGIQGFLVKPIDTQEMVALFNHVSAANTLVQGAAEINSDALPEPTLKQVLLVEDTPINQRLQSILLTRMGYEVTLASNGVEGVEAFNTSRFDLILMDIQMPEMGGIEATQTIRRLEQTRQLAKTPIIAVTANALIGDRERYFEAGMDGYVSKPLSSDSLKTEIERVLAR